MQKICELMEMQWQKYPLLSECTQKSHLFLSMTILLVISKRTAVIEPV